MYGYGYSNSFALQRGVPLDADALAFITAASITNPVIRNAINFRVRSFKGLDTSFNPTGADLWTSDIYADYPYVGGNATAHGKNLRNPAAHLMTWHGGMIHDANGITGNGIDSYGQSDFTPNNLGQNTAGKGAYVRTLGMGTKAIMLVYSNVSFAFEMNPMYTDNKMYFAVNDGESNTAETIGTGTFLITRQDASTVNVFIRSNAKVAKTISSGAPSTRFMVTLAYNQNGTINNSSAKNLGSDIYFQASLTDAKAQAYNAIEQQFQTLLGRNV